MTMLQYDKKITVYITQNQNQRLRNKPQQIPIGIQGTPVR